MTEKEKRDLVSGLQILKEYCLKAMDYMEKPNIISEPERHHWFLERRSDINTKLVKMLNAAENIQTEDTNIKDYYD